MSAAGRTLHFWHSGDFGLAGLPGPVNQNPLRDHLQTAHTPRHWSLFLVSNPNYSEASKPVCIPSPNITIQFGPLWVCDAPSHRHRCVAATLRAAVSCFIAIPPPTLCFTGSSFLLATFYPIYVHTSQLQKLKGFQVTNLIGSDQSWKVQQFLPWMQKMWRQEPILRKTNRIAGKANQGVIRQQKVGRRRNQDDWL